MGAGSTQSNGELRAIERRLAVEPRGRRRDKNVTIAVIIYVLLRVRAGQNTSKKIKFRTLNPLVVGSIPTRPTNTSRGWHHRQPLVFFERSQIVTTQHRITQRSFQLVVILPGSKSFEKVLA